MSPLQRTHATELRDDELIVFDALFDTRVSPSALQREHFGERHNLGYVHQLSDAVLTSTLEDLCGRGLVAVERSERTWVSLTPAGGGMWEAERTPDWQLYCSDSNVETDGQWVLQVKAVDRGVGESFIEAGVTCGLFEAAVRKRTVGHRTSGLLVPWKQADYYLLTAQVAPRRRTIDWQRYETQRRWWRTVTELISLKRPH